MSKKEYAELLKSILKLQIRYIEEGNNYEYSDLEQGKVIGLEIALEKIDASMFLVED